MGGQESAPRTLVLENEECNVVKVPVTSAVSRAVAASEKEGAAADSSRQSIISEQWLAKQARYEERIKSLELKNATLFEMKQLQLMNAVKRVEDKYLKVTEPVVCADQQSAVIQCYSAHPHETLKCAALVHAFNNCTLQYRQVVNAQ